jgi:hypothetical protein
MSIPRLFEVATAAEWRSADLGSHLDVWQALQHLKSGADPFVKLPVKNSDRVESKRKVILDYASRMEMSVKTRHRDGWILIKNVTLERQATGRRHSRRLPKELV